MMPWWICAILAVVTLLVCHAVSTAEVAPAKNINEITPMMFGTALKVLASLGQFVLPVVFVAAAIASALARPKAGVSCKSVEGNFKTPAPTRPFPERLDPSGTVQDQLPSDNYPIWIEDLAEEPPSEPTNITRWSIELLRALEWKRFEVVCAGLFELLGFTAKLCAPGADGGIDIHLFKPPQDRPVAAVQCKAWKGSSKVGVRYIRELHGVIASRQVSEGIFATTATFSEEAKAYAKENHIDLLDGPAILKSIQALSEEHQSSLLQLAIAGDFTTPTCPSCGVKMVAREPKAGGDSFWGCTNYPRCRTILSMAKA